jgi:hypothetical protein
MCRCLLAAFHYVDFGDLSSHDRPYVGTTRLAGYGRLRMIGGGTMAISPLLAIANGLSCFDQDAPSSI